MHKITNVIPETLTGDCLECGPSVSVRYNVSRKHYRCRTKDNETKRISAERTRSPEKTRIRNLRVVFGITLDQFNELMAKQEFRCALCNNEFKTDKDKHIDHDHSCCPYRKSCGKCIRAILCSNCNTGLGLFKDNTDLLAKAIAYIETKPQHSFSREDI